MSTKSLSRSLVLEAILTPACVFALSSPRLEPVTPSVAPFDQLEVVPEDGARFQLNWKAPIIKSSKTKVIKDSKTRPRNKIPDPFPGEDLVRLLSSV